MTEKIGYFFLYPVGQIGLIPATFLVNFPFMQVMVIFFIWLLTGEGVDVTEGVGEALGVGVGDAVITGVGVGVGVGAKYLTLIVGVEKVKPLALK